MKKKIASRGLILLSFMCCTLPAFAISIASKSSASLCSAVDCDCDFIESPKWEKLCHVREQFIVKECRKNAGKPKGYCGLHGPKAYPVATSIQYRKRPKLNSDISPEYTAKTVQAQEWSLHYDFKVLQETKSNVVEAMQIFNLFKKTSAKLFDKQLQVILGFEYAENSIASIAFAESSSKSMLKLAKGLSLLGDNLWQRTFSLKNGNRKKAYKSLAFKVTRESATLFERAGSLYASALQNKKAASTWQRAADVTKKLISWELESSNKAKYIAYYQKQATARINRATVYWLKAQALDKAVESISNVSDRFSKEESKVLRGMGLQSLPAEGVKLLPQ